MKVKVEINATQIIDNQKVQENNICDGNIQYYNNGAILEFIEKHEEQELKFKITILDKKVITKRNGEEMIFDLENKTKSTLNTPYGIIKMNILAKKIELEKEEEQLRKIYLEYEIELEDTTKYINIVEININ